MSRVDLRLESELLLCQLLKLFEFLLLSLFEDFDSVKEVFIKVVLVTLRDDIIRCGVNLWLKSAVALCLIVNLLLLVLHFELSL